MYTYSLISTGSQVERIMFNCIPDDLFQNDLMAALQSIQADFTEPGEHDPPDVALIATDIGFFQFFTQVNNSALVVVDGTSDLADVVEILRQSEKFELITSAPPPISKTDDTPYTGDDDYNEFMDDGIFGFKWR